MFADASALCAVLLDEPEKDAALDYLLGENRIFVSAVVGWECMRAIAKEVSIDRALAARRVSDLLSQIGAMTLNIGEAEQRFAIEAYARYGKGQHAAKLNMGDCFAYACAKSNDLPLLFKGNDFGQTDLATVRLG